MKEPMGTALTSANARKGGVGGGDRLNSRADSQRTVIVARALVVASFVTIMFSPPATNVLQAALFAMFLSSRDLRARLWLSVRQPLVMGALAFFVILIAGASYSFGGPSEGFGMVWGWRKLLMLPIAVALFDDWRSKLVLLRVMVTAAVIVAIASFAVALIELDLPNYLGNGVRGILVRNHATQGMIFAMAAFGCGSLALFPAMGEPIGRRCLWTLAAIVLAANTVLITPGRSGYLSLLVATVCLGVGWSVSRKMPLVKVGLIALSVAATFGAVLAISPMSKQRIEQATSEMRSYSSAQELTSMGIRMYFWQNTVSLVRQRPLFGWGTGGFEAAYAKEVAGRTGLEGVGTSDPHNQFLKIAVEHGLFGLAVFSCFLLTALRQQPALHFRLLGLGALAAWSATSMANSHFSTYAEGTFIYLWVGAMLANEVSVSPAES